MIGLLLAGLLRAPGPATPPEKPPLAADAQAFRQIAAGGDLDRPFSGHVVGDIVRELRHGEGHHQPGA